MGGLTRLFGMDEPTAPTVVAPAAPPPPPTMPVPDDAEAQAAKRRARAQAQARQGRQSTILSQQDNADPLGV